ncbi:MULTISPECIES: FGGY family carbohydrate kinase [Parabacteroides]|uniref:sedoheptulokinase n=1 Tax=Parabacteroides leei TaxID=2939491 RepID=UPI001899699F|nr:MULTISPECIES: FGGY family carbohydrate kinase [Parabacteroides]MCL3852842.1 FGGY family carbohydrate kinase [Parabacteroides leei]
MCFIGIDIGTSSISSVAYDLKKNKIESVTITNDSTIVSEVLWEKTQSPGRIIEIVEEIMDDFSSRYPDIKGIGVTGQMHGILYLNEQGEAVSPLYTWQDGRGNQLYRDNKTYAAYLSDETGYALATGFGLVTHFYNQVNGLVPGDAKQICTIMDYVVMKLAGQKTPLTDYSNGASIGFFDTENLCFDHAALDKVGIDLSILPELSESATCCGYNKQQIPVYSAIGDNQAAFLGSVKDIHHSIHITVGTSSQISVYSDKFIKIPELDTRPFPGGGYILVGAALCGGQAFVLLKNFFEQTLRFFLPALSDEQLQTGGLDFYQVMTSVPYKKDVSGLPIVETLFDGTRFAPCKRGHIENISLSNFTPENLILGFLKGISRELYNFYQRLPENIRHEKDVIVGSGNALKRNPLLCQAFEELFGCKLSFSLYQEEAAFGACLSAVKGEDRCKIA